ncbi:ATP synthase protein I [Paraperlucidibaca baekdonensis]|uniref:ATP synthase protein I n=2 Tax=Paraperlucidibaca baekdonensis TaxID=748120 RepID=A0A3E0H8V6_9GAMM|nr:ATP synthase protein I [Paraperlucidibaca baekdonensis]
MTVSKPQPLVEYRPALQQLKWQARLMVALWLIAQLAGGTAAGLSALSGAGIAVLGQAYFVFRAFRHAGARSAQHIVQEFYRGEAGKFLLTALLFASVFIFYKKVDPVWLFTGFVLEQLVAWIVPLANRNTQR